MKLKAIDTEGDNWWNLLRGLRTNDVSKKIEEVGVKNNKVSSGYNTYPVCSGISLSSNGKDVSFEIMAEILYTGGEKYSDRKIKSGISRLYLKSPATGDKMTIYVPDALVQNDTDNDFSNCRYVGSIVYVGDLTSAYKGDEIAVKLANGGYRVFVQE